MDYTKVELEIIKRINHLKKTINGEFDATNFLRQAEVRGLEYALEVIEVQKKTLE